MVLFVGRVRGRAGSVSSRCGTAAGSSAAAAAFSGHGSLSTICSALHVERYSCGGRGRAGSRCRRAHWSPGGASFRQGACGRGYVLGRDASAPSCAPTHTPAGSVVLHHQRMDGHVLGYVDTGVSICSLPSCATACGVNRRSSVGVADTRCDDPGVGRRGRPSAAACYGLWSCVFFQYSIGRIFGRQTCAASGGCRRSFVSTTMQCRGRRHGRSPPQRLSASVCDD